MGSAYAEFADGWKGSITEGKVADLVVLSHDILATPPRQILDAHVVHTVVGGRVVYENDPQSGRAGSDRAGEARPAEDARVPAR